MTYTKCKIAGTTIQDNFDVYLEKREFFILNVKNTSKEIRYKFYRLRNHFVTCEIHHEQLNYVGHVSIRDVETYDKERDTLNISFKVCFEA